MEALIWQAIHACLDLAYIVGVFGWSYHNSGLVYMELVKNVWWYVSGTLHLGLKFDREVDILDDIVRYIDFNFAESKIDQKSTRRYIFKLTETAIKYLFKL